MIASKKLRGILYGGSGNRMRNPMPHSPLLLHNQLEGELIGPDGTVKKRIHHVGNIMATYGLNRLVEMLASDAGGASAWVSAMAIGTGTSGAASTQDTLQASTAIKHLSEASMVASDGGNLTLQYNATFDDSSAYEIHEAGLFCTNAATDKMASRIALTGTQSVNKQAADTFYCTYKVVVGTV